MDKNRALKIEKTVEIYLDHAKALMSIVPVIQKFDGKIVNKRLDTEMQKVLPKGQGVRWVTKYGWLNIELWNINNWIDGARGYTDNREHTVRCGEYETVFTADAGKWRLKAGPVIDAINKEIGRIHERANMLLDAYEKADQIRDEAAAAVEPLVAFCNKYDYEVKELLGLRFSVTNQSKDEDYSIKTY